MRSLVAIGFRTAVAPAETDAPPAFAGPNPDLASFSDLELAPWRRWRRSAINTVNALRRVPCQKF